MHKRHEHCGKSTKGRFDAELALKTLDLQAGNAFLDLGCADGWISLLAAAQVGPQGKVFALDIHEPSIELVKQLSSLSGLPQVEAIHADATRMLPLPEAGVDICLLSNILHGFVANQELDAVMAGLQRVLKPGALLGVIEIRPEAEGAGPPQEVRLSSEAVASALAPFRFASQSTVEVGLQHYLTTLRWGV